MKQSTSQLDRPTLRSGDAMTPYPAALSDTSAAESPGELARRVITLRDLAEVEREALAALRAAAAVKWTALYRPGVEGMALVRAEGLDAEELPGELPATGAVRSLDESGIWEAYTEDDLGGVVPDVAGCALLRMEFEPRPTLVLFGPGTPGGVARTTELGSMLEICGAAMRNAELIERLNSQVFVDVLTGCYNRRGFEEHLTVELVRARRYDRPLCLLLLDLDDFKRVNDALGHPIGDHALQRVGEVLRTSFRTTDRVCRFGGDEFAIIFPETSRQDILRLAERLRRRIGKLFPDELVPRELTPSIGVAVFPRDASVPNALIEAADRALYRAKKKGRDQVALA